LKLRSSKLANDIGWTLGSFVVLAASGLIINILVAALRDTSDLGVFNLSYAVYIIASQIAVFGLQYSTMRYSALHREAQIEREKLLFNSGFMALVFGAIVSAILLLAWPALAILFSSETTGIAIRNAAWGLLFFPLNKVLLGYLNGLREMKAFSLLQSLRYVVVMLWVGFISASDYDFAIASYAFVIAELLTTLCTFLFLSSLDLRAKLSFDMTWIKLHFRFGAKSLLAGMFVEMNSRVDVLIIGIFLPSKAVGIYSFAAILIDGLYQILAMIRLNINPILVGALRDKDFPSIQRLLSRSKRVVYPTIAGISMMLMIAFFIFTTYIMPEKNLAEGLLPLAILLAAVTSISAFIPFDNLLLTSGHPGYQTIQHLALVISNIALSASLVPLLGINGAAVATAFSYIIGIAVLMHLAKRLVKWNVLTNTVEL